MILYGDQNFDLIIAIGFMWNDAVIDAAQKYSNSKFVIVDTELSESKNNAVSILFDVDEAAFPLGFLSAWWADTHDSYMLRKLGWVAALSIFHKFNNLLSHIITAQTITINNMKKVLILLVLMLVIFLMRSWESIFADSLITLGADVIFGVGSETGNGSLLKAKELGKVGIGVDVDQYYSFPEVSDILLSSAMKGLDNAIYEVVKSFVDNTFLGSDIYNGKTCQ